MIRGPVIIACVGVLISFVASLYYILDMFRCPICSDFTAISNDNLSRHSRQYHEAAFLANFGLGHSKYERPDSSLPRCDVCNIYIGKNMSYSHSTNPFHLTNLESARIQEEEARCAADAEGTGDDAQDQCQSGYDSDEGGASQEDSGLGRRGESLLGVGGVGAGAAESCGSDWMSRGDNLQFVSHPWIGEVLLSAIKLDRVVHIDKDRNLNWKFYNRLRIVDVKVVDGVEVCF